MTTQNEKENDQSKKPRSLILRLQTPDQRYVVIRAIAKPDPVLAKQLTQEMLKEDPPQLAPSQNKIRTVSSGLHKGYT